MMDFAVVRHVEQLLHFSHIDNGRDSEDVIVNEIAIESKTSNISLVLIG